MSAVATIHLPHPGSVDATWCAADFDAPGRTFATIGLVNCLECLLACAEYGSEARHRREVLIEGGAK